MSRTPVTLQATTSLWQEFKAFALKGNFIDLAVAVVLGSATTALINSLVKNVIMPILSYVTPAETGYLGWHVGRVQIGVFLGEVVYFLAVATALFLVMVKFLGAVQRAALPPSPDEPATKECPLCLSVIPARARRCAHCAADLPTEAR